MEEETAVDWFANRIKHGGLVSKKKFDELLEQAIAIEKAAKAKEYLRGYTVALNGGYSKSVTTKTK